MENNNSDIIKTEQEIKKLIRKNEDLSKQTKVSLNKLETNIKLFNAVDNTIKNAESLETVYGVCCFCGDDCNFHSQCCGRCARSWNI
jgi:hypothetical protein